MIMFMKKLFVFPVIWLILGAVAIATEIKTTDLIPAWQELSGTVVACIKTALEKKETTILSVFTTYQKNNFLALESRKKSLLAAWDKSTKSEVKNALSAAWKTYKKSFSENKSTLHTSRNLAWSMYKTEVKSCKWNSILQNVDSSSERSEQ